MNSSKMLIAALIGAVVNFLLGWLVYGILLKDAMVKGMTAEANALNKPEPNLAGIFVACLISSLLLAYIFERWAKIRTWMSGLTAAATIGFLFAASMDISLWSMLNMYSSSSFIIVDVLASTLMTALTGAAIGWFLGFNRKD